MQSSHSREKSRERTRNFLLVLLAGIVVAIFFNLDMLPEGETVFERSADRKLTFAGDLGRKDFTPEERAQIMEFIRRHDSRLANVTIEITLQDPYRAVTDTTEVIFSVRMAMADGGSVSAPTRRARRSNLVPAVLDKLDKDIKAYGIIDDGDGKGRSLINTM
ncbi:hypothetical protein [Pseudodesulfovibrio pelocollis]|uniref:hypothetical protein n=1 Tax=Pseudodesulfovibrio pelocollis TaxID=3051432 RepID=UPI00255AAD0E|nr:hypothetical protein [Pseudodesulfovibrio sp. SB368]